MTGQPAPARRGCLFYGCITGVVMLLLVMGGLLVALHYAKKMVLGLTDAQPVELPAVAMRQGDRDKLKRRCDGFEAALREQRPAAPLTLSADEINVLIADDPRQQALKGRVHVSLEGDQLKSQLSVPLEEVGLHMFKGRYLNGDATFNLSFQDGVLAVKPRTIRVKGKPLPEVYMREIRKRNLAAAITNQPQAVALLRELEDVRVKDGGLTIMPQRKK